MEALCEGRRKLDCKKVTGLLTTKPQGTERAALPLLREAWQYCPLRLHVWPHVTSAWEGLLTYSTCLHVQPMQPQAVHFSGQPKSHLSNSSRGGDNPLSRCVVLCPLLQEVQAVGPDTFVVLCLDPHDMTTNDNSPPNTFARQERKVRIPPVLPVRKPRH